MRRIFILTLVGIACVYSTSVASTWRVPEDAPSIAAALSYCTPGDTVTIACGTYYESDLNVPSGVVIYGDEPVPSCVTIDPQGSGRAFSGSAISIIGLRIINGLANGGGAITGSGVIRSCILENNRAGGYPFSYNGGAVLGSFNIYNSLFLGNGATGYGGAVSEARRVSGCVFNGNGSGREWGGALFNTPIVEACEFTDNSAYSGGQAIYFKNSSGTVEDSRFWENRAHNGVIRGFGASPTIRRCIFYDNGAGTGASLDFVAEIGGSALSPRVENCTFAAEGTAIIADANTAGAISVTVINSIVAFSQNAFQSSSGAGLVRSCCVVWDNGGKSVRGLVSADDIQQDPLFCDLVGRDLSLNLQSPCLPENSGGCGIIGALPAGCDDESEPSLDYLWVDIGDGHWQQAYWGFPSSNEAVQSFATSMALDGSVTVALYSEAIGDVSWRIRDGIDYGPYELSSDLLHDFTFATPLQIRIEGLLPGWYAAKTYHHDTAYGDHGSIDITVQDSRGTTDVVSAVVQTTGYRPDTVATADFEIVANGGQPVVVEFRVVSGTGNVAVLNGFEIEAIDEPVAEEKKSLGGIKAMFR